MERWTVAVPSDGRYRLHIIHGGTPYWCMFDFAVRTAPDSGGVEIGLSADADGASAEWFPHLREGMLCGLETAHEHGREWVGVRVEVRKVHTHLTATTARGCERYGFSFVLDELLLRGTELSWQSDTEPRAVTDRGLGSDS